MVVSASYELQSFAASAILGFAIGIIYDLLRSIRHISGKNLVPDALMWAASCAFSAVVWYEFLNGEMRWYMAVGVVSSGVLYFLLFSRAVFCAFFLVVRKIYCFFNIILKFLLTPLRFLGKIICVYIEKAKNKFFRKVVDCDEEKEACI